MWCTNCGQDVPGIASKKREGAIVCARCGTNMGTEAEPDTDSATSHFATNPFDDVSPPADFGDWESEEDIRTAEYLVKRINAQTSPHLPVDQRAAVPDGFHDAVGQWHAPSNRSAAHAAAADRAAVRPRSPKHRLSRIAALIAGLGTMVLLCGGGLLLWAYSSGRNDVWSLGLSLTVGGQALLILGVFLQVDGLWRNNRATSQSIDELDENLADLRHATTMLGTTHSSAARSFYVHMAEGASPELMLADLKGQLDMLSLRLARQRNAV